MNKFYLAIVLWFMFSAPTLAAERDPDRWVEECVGWNNFIEIEKSAWLVGWLRGIMAADNLTKDLIMPDLWPTGHRVGSVVVEIDVKCRRPENKNALLSDLIQVIAREKNKVN
jgi:hypothetical protein